MITRGEYIKALNIVEAYHKQLNLSIIESKFIEINLLQKTDFVECIKTDSNTIKCLTMGKKYQIIGFNDCKSRFQIIDDNGNPKAYATDYHAFKAVVPDYAQRIQLHEDFLTIKLE